MALEQYANSPTPSTPSTAWATLVGAMGAGDLTLTVSSATPFPTAAQFRLLIENEWMLVTGVAGAVFTVTRGIEGSTAVAHSAGTGIYHILTAGSFQTPTFLNVTIAPSAAGLGPALTITGATETTSNPLISATQTWNAAGVTFTAFKLNVINSASAAASLLMDLQIGGTSQFQVTKSGQLLAGPTGTQYTFGGSGSAISYTGNLLITTSGGDVAFSSNFSSKYAWGFRSGTGNLQGSSDAAFGFTASAAATNTTGVDGTFDTILLRDAAATFAQRNGVNAQGFNLYNTFTSTTNFERLMLDWITTANVAMIYTQKGSGGGTARVLQVNYGGTTTSAISIPITSGAITLGGGLTLPGGATFLTTNTALTDGAGVQAGTLATAPAAGNPTKWIGINDNGTTRFVPSW